ncbi:kinase-like domain-containing protein [Rhizophagus clarus]|uniref:Kinase-like domain-containing protein n=1 Tax=Rhizophagus clarus TaxID=94130 RepID=A0A8H3R6H1_9GLOM|nr:kinase-like domain-containing protein [Rhizophagus clarus]
MYSLNEKSDVYSVGVLLWEISIGRPPFCAEGDHYDVGLVYDISQGLRETVIPGTPDEYVKDVGMVNQICALLYFNKQGLNDASLTTNNTESQGELFKFIQNFDKMSTKDLDNIVKSFEQKEFLSENSFNKVNTKDLDNILESFEQEEFLPENDFNMVIVDEVNDLIFKLLDKGIEGKLLSDQVILYFGNITNLLEFYSWLSSNQNSPNSIFLFGYFNYLTLGKAEKAFNLFINAEKNHILTQYYIAKSYLNGHGTVKNEKLAFEYFQKVADNNFTHGQSQIGNCYKNGVADLGEMVAQYNLGTMYENGKGITKDINKAIYWYEKAAKKGYQKAQID